MRSTTCVRLERGLRCGSGTGDPSPTVSIDGADGGRQVAAPTGCGGCMKARQGCTPRARPRFAQGAARYGCHGRQVAAPTGCGVIRRGLRGE